MSTSRATRWANHAAAPKRRLLSNARRRSKVFGIRFDLTSADLEVMPTHCPILGIPLSWEGGRAEMGSTPSLDRIDPALGYVRGNVQIISTRANVEKGSSVR